MIALAGVGSSELGLAVGGADVAAGVAEQSQQGVQTPALAISEGVPARASASNGANLASLGFSLGARRHTADSARHNIAGLTGGRQAVSIISPTAGG